MKKVFSRKIFFRKLFLNTYNANWRRLLKRLGRTCESLLLKVQKNNNFLAFFQKNNCPQTKIWPGEMMLLPFLSKEPCSNSDMFKIHKKRMKTNWREFDTVLRQLWENWLNSFVRSVKSFRSELGKKLNLFVFQTICDSNILF